MRRLLFPVFLLVLVCATCWLWAYRFERVEGLPSWTLADIRSAAPEIPGLEWEETNQGVRLKVAVDDSNPRIGAKLTIPGVVPADFLHLRFQMDAIGLQAGEQPWADGRFMVDWQPIATPSITETDPIGTIRDDIEGDFQDIVVGSVHPPAVPSLRVEHLGRSGEFRISDLRIEVIQERWLWKIGKWLLLGAWWAWAFLFVRSWPGTGHVRSALAAAVWILVGTQFVIPGPWKIQRPIYPNFQLGAGNPTQRVPSPASTGASETNVNSQSGPLETLGEIPIQGSPALRLKLTIQRARPLLHLLMLFAPAFAIALLVGIRPALWLSMMSALAIELGQVAFGYGFGWDDIGDLVCDLLGILLAVWVSQKVLGFLRKWRRTIASRQKAVIQELPE